MSESAAAQNQQCIFCRIISGEIPSRKIFEDEHVLVILDINPASDGHCIVLPKEHYQILPQLPESEIAQVFTAAKKTSHVLLKALGATGTTIFLANGALAGQKSPHFMLHVVPRMENDSLFDIPKNSVKEKDIEAIKELYLKKFNPPRNDPVVKADAPKADIDEITRLFSNG
jgi:histidine triad (HIT) family protein